MSFEDDEEEYNAGFSNSDDVSDEDSVAVQVPYAEEYDILDIRTTAAKEANVQALIARRRVEELLIERDIKTQVDYLLEEEFE